jgi:NAD-dependent deacetylase
MDQVDAIVRFLKGARSVLFVTGAGVSAESGLPTYRGVGGLYNDKVTPEGIPIETALAGEMLHQRPEVTWKYLAQIEQRCRKARPNRAHEVIAAFENEFQRVWVLTQNIDGFHYAAGSHCVIDIHGDFHDIACMRCSWRTRVKDYAGLAIPPRCPECQAVARPEVVFFGEMLPEKKIAVLVRELRRGFDVTFSIGTTSVFPYIQQPILLAHQSGRPTVEINPSGTEVSDIVDVAWRSGAAQALDALWRAWRKQKGQ